LNLDYLRRAGAQPRKRKCKIYHTSVKIIRLNILYKLLILFAVIMWMACAYYYSNHRRHLYTVQFIC